MFDMKDFYAKDELVKLTQALIQIPSHKDSPDREKAVADYIHSFCRKNGLESELIPVEGKRCNVMVYLRGEGAGRHLLLNGHTDTVPPYNMTIDPFAADIRDDCIWGRGAVDMKGPIASMLITMLALKRSGLKLEGKVTFSGVIGEEEKSEGTEYLVSSGFKADGAVVGEPSNYEYAVGHRGLEWLEIVIRGKAAHGGVPHLGINAIEKAAKFIDRITRDLYPRLKGRFNEYMGPSVMNLGAIQGGNQPSTVADYCSIKIDRRYIPGETVASVLQEYQSIIDDLNAEDPDFNAEILRMPNNMLKLDHLYLMTPPDDPIAVAVRESIKEIINKEPCITRQRGWTDAALLSNYLDIPAVVFGPGNISFSHTKDERVKISELVDAVDIYFKIIQKYCGVKD